MSQTTIYPWGKDKPPVFFDNEDKTLRKFKSICSYKGYYMTKQVQSFSVTYAKQVGVETGNPYEDFKKACDTTNSAMVRQVRIMMEEFIKNNRVR